MPNVILFFLLLFTFCNEANAQVMDGHCIIQNTTLDELTCNGPADISNTMIKGKLTINGPLNMNKCDVKTLEVHGAADINNSIIHDRALFFGALSANSTQFLNDIYAETTQIKLIQSTIAGDINIRGNTQPPILELTEHAVINGNVTFTTLEGITKLAVDSEVKGSVSNGKQETVKAANKTEK